MTSKITDPCPNCGEQLEYDEVDIGVGVLRGNPGCPNCHWTPPEKILMPDIPKHDLDKLAERVHAANQKWWYDPASGQPLQRNVGELLMLTVSELAEAMEGHRKDLQDDKLPYRKMFEVEIADAIIRLLDLAGGMHLDLGGAFEEKMAFNAVRHDHTHEARLAPGGKKY